MNDYEKPDFWSKKAKKEGFAARSIYKLDEINKKFNLIKEGQNILDLGCAPGSWSQFISEKIGETGTLIGIDYKQITVNLKNAHFIYGNFLREHNQEKIMSFGPYDGIVSDMAPDTTGDKLTDCYASSELVNTALDFSYRYLKKGGFFVAKIFQGGDEINIMESIKNSFTFSKWFKPDSCRKKSFEIFIIGSGYKGKIEQSEKEVQVINMDEDSGIMPW